MNEVFASPGLSDAVWLSCDYAKWLFQKNVNRGVFQSSHFKAAAVNLSRWMKPKLRDRLMTFSRPLPVTNISTAIHIQLWSGSVVREHYQRAFAAAQFVIAAH